MESTNTVEALVAHTHTVIFLHGRDSTATEFATEIFESQGTDEKTLPEALPSFQWVFPSSKQRESARFGTSISQWFDIWSVQEPQEQPNIQKQGLHESVAEILDLIDNEVKSSSIPPERIVLAGISQGCATAIHALFNHGRLGGFVGLSSWLPYADQIKDICVEHEAAKRLQHIKAISSQNREATSKMEACFKIPLFLGHCKDDEVVPYANGQALCKGLERLGMAVEWHGYPSGGHWLNEPEGVDDLVRFLQSIAGGINY